MKRRDWAVAIALALCAATLAACGSSAGDGGSDDPAEQEEAGLEFAACMREHGIDMPDPEFEAGGKVKMRIGGQGGGPSPESPAFQKAQEACGSKGPGGDGFMFGAPPK